MALDIFFGLIFLCSVIMGIRSGFLAAVFHACGWLAAVICGFIFNSDICRLLSEHTGIYDSIREDISLKFSNSVSRPLCDLLPVPDGFSQLLDKTADPAVTAAADAVYSVVCFALTVAAVMIVLFLLLRLFSKKYTDGLLGFADGVLGGLAGALRGVILILIASALLFPAVSLLAPESAAAVTESLESSRFALYIYENNPFIEIMDTTSDMYISSLLGR